MDAAGALAMVASSRPSPAAAGPDLFACMFLVVAVLELYGTRMGVWEWRAPGRGCRSACATASADSPPAAAARRIATAAAVRRIAPAPGR